MKNGKKQVALSLAKPGDPYVDDRGNVIQPERVKPKAPPTPELDVKEFRPTSQRDLRDLPAPPKMFNGIACAFIYTLFGVGDREIAETLGITVKDLKSLREHDAYRQCFNVVLSELISVNSNNIKARIAAYAIPAFAQVAHLAINAKKEETQLTASRDILDRGGFNPKSLRDEGGMGINDLRIQIIDGTKEVHITTNGGIDG